MSKLKPEARAQQDRVHELIVAMYPQHRVLHDANLETVLWLNSPSELHEVVKTVRTESGLMFDRLSDLTAYDNIDGRDGPKRFVMAYNLYSTQSHTRLRIKVAVGEHEPVPTLVSFWRTANWLERETFDMFGVRFTDHPDLRRIMMDERFEGYPLRKEYDLKDRQPFPDSLPVRIAGQATPTERAALEARLTEEEKRK